MARPSLASPSMAELVNQAKNRRKSTPPSTLGGSSRSLLGDDEIASTGISSVAPKLPPIHHSQPELSSSYSEAEHEQLKRKYAVQNQTLAKNNSIMLSKLSSMETRLSELISENALIRRQKSLKEGAIKDTLHRKLLKIEDSLYEKFDDIFQMFQDIRSLEDLPTNPKLKVFKQKVGKEAIALTTGESTVLNPVNDTLGINRQLSVGALLEEETESPVKLQQEIAAFGQRMQTIQTETSVAGDAEKKLMVAVEPKNRLTTLEPNVAESVKSVKSKPESDVVPARRLSVLTEPELVADKRKSVITELITDKRKLMYTEQGLSDKRLSMVTEPNSVADKRASISTEPNSDADKRSSISTEPTASSKRKSILNESRTRKRRISAVNDQEQIESKTTKPTISKQAQLLNSDENKNANDKTFQVFSDVPSRPRRARKEVDYKTPSLNKKMRRETEWLVTAVGNEPIIKKIQKENTPPDVHQQTQGLRETKSKKVEVKSEFASTTHTNREPLQKIDINSRDTIQSKILNKQPEDLSIFDFDDEAENRAPPIKKTYKRRVQALDLRRHSML